MAQCKYAMREHQISYDDGFSWVSLEVIKGDLIEYQSADCPDSGSEITKWVDLEGDYICEENRKYKKQVLYVSYDGGATWYIYFPTIYQKGEYVGIDDEFCNNKFEGHYESGGSDPTTYLDPLRINKCNDSTTLTSGDTLYYVGGYTLISAKIGDCVTTIGDGAFFNYTRLSTITIPSGITSIGDSAFYRCSGLQSIIVEAIIPPTLGSTVFGGTNNCPIYVPCQSVEAYKTAWSAYASRIQDNTEYRWIDDGTLCDNANKYYKEKQQATCDSGATWIDTGQVRKKSEIPIEVNSYECGYRTRIVTSTTICINGDLYEYDLYQESRDSGVTWTTTATSATTLIESGSSECNYINHYLTFIPISSSTTFQFSNDGLSYSIDYGYTWTSLNRNTNTPSVGVGDKIMFKGNLTPSWSSIYKFSGSSEFDVEGNVMSLLYGDNFSGQTDLTSKNYAFYRLFSGCTTLVSAENLVLPATTLANYCYSQMFNGCTSLTTAPELPATTLAYGCYNSMFSGCTSLTTAPILQATTMEYYCCQGMFGSCTSLTTVPVLSATTLEQACYADMFANCTSLTTVPSNMLPATTLATQCYGGMFRNCTSLTTAPQLPATTLATACYNSMFNGCTSLTTAPTVLPATTAYGYSYMFANCTSLTVAPVLSATTVYECSYMFDNCTSLTTVPSNMLPATSLTSYCYEGMFRGCTSLTTAPQLPATTMQYVCYRQMFAFCTSLTTAPELPATTLYDGCYQYMFQSCTSLTTAPSVLSATTLAQGCYNGMFYGCTSLQTAPILPATTLVGDCYYGMFSGCTSLNEITCLATDISATNCTKNWVYNVFVFGAFYKNPSMTSWGSGMSGIPTNWTVLDAT